LNPELFGIGRTWVSVWAILAISAGLLWFGKVDQDTWMLTTLGSLGVGGGKSGVQQWTRAKADRPPPVPD
jgi:hypothetical protein